MVEPPLKMARYWGSAIARYKSTGAKRLVVMNPTESPIGTHSPIRQPLCVGATLQPDTAQGHTGIYSHQREPKLHLWFEVMFVPHRTGSEIFTHTQMHTHLRIELITDPVRNAHNSALWKLLIPPPTSGHALFLGPLTSVHGGSETALKIEAAAAEPQKCPRNISKPFFASLDPKYPKLLTNPPPFFS